MGTGGSSAIDGQFLLQGVPENYDNWAAWGNEEWGFIKVLPYFQKLEMNIWNLERFPSGVSGLYLGFPR